MNKYFRKFKKNAKALSPVVASIILIAVTVAVQASIANIAFIGTNQIDVLVQNSGSTTVNITQAFVNGVGATITTTAGPLSVDKSTATTFHVTSPTLSAGTSYQIKLITAKGTQIQNSAVYNP
jgi:flagellin-like protein